MLATCTGLEPVTSCSTGRRSATELTRRVPCTYTVPTYAHLSLTTDALGAGRSNYPLFLAMCVLPVVRYGCFDNERHVLERLSKFHRLHHLHYIPISYPFVNQG